MAEVCGSYVFIFSVCMCANMFVCLYVMFLLPPYMGKGIEEEETCAVRLPIIAIFYFSMVMKFWALMILAEHPSTIK